MTDPRQIADAYIDIWNTAEAPARAERIARLWAEDASFADPMASARGHGEIDAVIARVRAAYPGMTFAVEGTPDGLGDTVRFSWSMALPGQPPMVKGTDIATLDGAGRIRAVTGFLDLVPQGAAAE